MDFLDPRKHRAHMIRLIIGYVLIGVAVLIATVILLYQAYGFGLDKNGEVVQNGLVFVSSQPNGAEIYINNKLYKNTTNSRLQLPEGDYSIDVKRTGYRPWHRNISVTGNSVSRYDYPLLIPTSLAPAPLKSYAGLPAFASQSPDRRWLLVSQPGSVLNFDAYDLADPTKIGDNLKTVALPASVVTGSVAGEHAWKLLEWSTNNRHVVLEHTYSGGREYVLVDREEPARSVNLTKTLGLEAGQILSLRDKKFDKYYVFDPAAKTVSSLTLNEPAPVPVLEGVLAFKSYGADILLYATEAGVSAPGKVMTMLRDDDVTYKIQEIGAAGPFLLDLARYDGDWLVAVGASGDNKAYVFKNPQSFRKTGKVARLIPAQVLHVAAPNYLAFSSNTRFVMIENGNSFAVYDAETDEGYAYTAALPLDAGQTHATWMDGHRITYASGGKTVLFDYDHTNAQTLAAAAPGFLPFFDRDYEYVYNLVTPVANGQVQFTGTSLRTEQDR